MKRILSVMVIMLISFLLFYAISCEAATVTLNPQNDNMVLTNSQNPQAKYTVYQNAYLGVGCNWVYSYLTTIQDFVCASSLVRFDVSSLAGKTISSATLRLVTYSVGVGYYPRYWHIRAMSTSWNPATVTWANLSGYQYYTNSEIDLLPPTSPSGRTYDIDVTSIVQAWASEAYNNNGLIFESADFSFPYATSFDAFEFYCLEDTGQEWPKLIVTYQSPCTTPGTPSGPSPSNGATGISTSLTLSWDCVNADSYDVYFGTSSNPPYVGNITRLCRYAGELSKQDYPRSGLSNSTTYYWKIVAKNTCGNSTSGPVWNFTVGTPVCTTPGTPSTPTPSNGATGISTSPTLSWATCTNTNSYDFYFGTSTNPPYVGNTTSPSYPRSGLSNSTTYYWKIVAKNTCGNSTSGPVWSFTPALRADFTGNWSGSWVSYDGTSP